MRSTILLSLLALFSVFMLQGCVIIVDNDDSDSYYNDGNNSYCNANENLVNLGQTYYKSISPTGDSDTFSIYLSAGYTYYFEAINSSSFLDIVINVYGTACNYQISGGTVDDYGDGASESGSIYVTSTGWFNFVVRDYNSNDTGNYSFRIY